MQDMHQIDGRCEPPVSILHGLGHLEEACDVLRDRVAERSAAVVGEDLSEEATKP